MSRHEGDCTSCKEAIKDWEDKNKAPAGEAKHVSLICQLPPIKKMDNRLNDLFACEQLSLSSNVIEKIGSLGLKNLRILSLGRNNIKRIEKLEDVTTLQQLWLSYNQIDRLDGLSTLKKLRVLYLSNNRIKKFDELKKLVVA